MKASRFTPEHLPRYHRRRALRLYKTEIRALLDAAKDAPCAACRNQYPRCCMQFDHLPGERKRFNLSEARAGLIPRHVVLQELRKCEVVCANCHAIREDRRKNLLL